MYPLGHLGIGVHLIPRRLRDGLRWRWLALGCLLPDLIDKPWWLWQVTLARPEATRLFGHTLVFCALLAVAARLLRSSSLRAIGLGALTHVALDFAGEILAGTAPIWKGWLLWPLFGWTFPVEGHAHPPPISETAIYLAGELAGAALLVWDFVQLRRARKR